MRPKQNQEKLLFRDELLNHYFLEFLKNISCYSKEEAYKIIRKAVLLLERQSTEEILVEARKLEKNRGHKY